MKDDALIDRVARDMTEGEPAADFRARVLGRLPHGRHGSWLRIAIPAGTIAALGLAWVMTGTTGTTGATGATGTTGTTGATGSATVGGRSSRRGPDRAGAAPGRHRGLRGPRSPVDLMRTRRL